MKIDITREPPADIFKNKSKYVLITVAALVLSGCGMALAAYVILSDTPSNGNLETVAFSLFIGPVFLVAYFGEKLQAYRRLTADQAKELADFGLKHPEIKTYCALVARAGRRPIMAEYEACQAVAGDMNPKNGSKE